MAQLSVLSGICICALSILSACGGSSEPNIVQFGVEQGNPVSLDTASVSQRTDTQNVLQTAPEFWQKAISEDEDTFYVRYARNFGASVGRTNHRVPMTERDYRGTTGQFGSRTFIDDGSDNPPKDLEGSTTSRTMTVFNIRTEDMSHGVMFTQDESARGSFLDSHAYAGGRAVTNIPTANADVTYSGVFLGHIAEAATTPTTDIVELDASLSINFGANTFTGAFGTGSGDDITLSGTRSSSGSDVLTGTATTSSTALGMASGRSGDVNGRIFGEAASSAAGSLAIEDDTGANFKVLVGSFGVTQ